MRLAVAHRSRPKVGALENGDGFMVRQECARTLVAVVDALGHGPVAAQMLAEEMLGLVLPAPTKSSV
ncbi:MULTISPECIES: hypothetical protein [Myxococcus]|uniref:hypothetical protein n=1 Tax=Myxococcus TaxID=32 RepID=UPI00034C6230|nr:MULTISPECIES: hypothetical protein [Myxococcus]NOJ54224.1 hypothetical protein [Myxococcus xanthus]QPM82249.1 hypothetical protein I5Q59_13645 [Myxococcus xanthus]QVW71496.1 hypothetical protein JTM82_19000 [Myxococcus xanthus DZ2]QZZ50476.1 hypothetical protein MyxoNM_14790 [Myxococcus xanthus]UEO02374.1 hypothetical protein K1515_23805 [Myxococcus xanthus DZ2]